MGRAGRECDGEGRKGSAWPSVEGQAAERVPQCKVFSQGAPAEELDEAAAGRCLSPPLEDKATLTANQCSGAIKSQIN